jgi:Tol biopolymer transport system component
MKKLGQLIFLTFSIVFAGCRLLGDNDNKSSFKNAVYANVYFEQLEPGFTPHGLIAINYNNPKEFKLLGSDTTAFGNIRLSPDGSMISYSDVYATGVGSTPWLGIYNTQTKTRELLIDKRYDASLVGNSRVGVVWDKDSSGFYYTNPTQAFDNTHAVWYYDLQTEMASIIKEVREQSIIPIGLMGGDTLIVTSNEFDTLNYYTMSLEGEYIKRIDNPHLEYVVIDGIRKKGFSEVSWNDSLKLFAGSYNDNAEFDRFKIAVTDLEGDVFKEFTNGEYRNTHPRWTRDGKIIFAEQRDLTKPHVDSELKLLDPETSEITDFFSEEQYPEITGVGNADQ